MESPGDPRGFLEAPSIARLVAASQGLVDSAARLAGGDYQHEGLAEQGAWEALEVAVAETRAALAAFLPGPPEFKMAGLGQIIQAREAIERIVAQPLEPDWSYAAWEAGSAQIQAIEDQLRTAGVRLLAFSVGDGRATYALGPTAAGWTVLTWVHGGFDRWKLNVGEVLAVPAEVADGLLKGEEALARLFGGPGR
jgi:hypothetical protein